MEWVAYAKMLIGALARKRDKKKGSPFLYIALGAAAVVVTAFFMFMILTVVIVTMVLAISSGDYVYPLPNNTSIYSAYGPREPIKYGDRYSSNFHGGVDFKDTEGTTIHASQAGVVITAGDTGGDYGLLVVIQHENGDATKYAHCSALLVELGEDVLQGQPIAEVGNTGFSIGPHLHFELVVGGEKIDPEPFLQEWSDELRAAWGY